MDLYQANRDVLKRPDRLEVGTVLVIPDLPASRGGVGPALIVRQLRRPTLP